MANKVEVSGGGGWVALALLIIYFWGDPNLHDALMHFLTDGKVSAIAPQNPEAP